MARWEASWNVESDSSDKVYVVSYARIENGGSAHDVWGCTCPRWINQRGSPEDRPPCKHIRKIKGQLALQGATTTADIAAPKFSTVVSAKKMDVGGIKTVADQKHVPERWKYIEI